MDWEKGYRNQRCLFPWMFFAGACLNQAHTRNSVIGESPLRGGQNPHDIGETQAGSLPEKPTKRVIRQISQANVGLSRRFSHSPFPAGNRHGGHAQLAPEVRLTQLAPLSDVFNFERPFGNGNSGFSRASHGSTLCAALKQLLNASAQRFDAVGFRPYGGYTGSQSLVLDFRAGKRRIHQQWNFGQQTLKFLGSLKAVHDRHSQIDND
jgi:hypothetical protein